MCENALQTQLVAPRLLEIEQRPVVLLGIFQKTPESRGARTVAEIGALKGAPSLFELRPHFRRRRPFERPARNHFAALRLAHRNDEVPPVARFERPPGL